MFDFKYFTPTKVLFGKNTENKVADLIQEFGVKKSFDSLRRRKCYTLGSYAEGYRQARRCRN